MKRVKEIWKRFLLWIGAATLLAASAGCATPSAKAVPAKSEAQQVVAIAQAAAETPAPTDNDAEHALRERFGIPASYTINLVDGKVSIQGTATVLVPNAEKLPCVSVSKHLFTQAEADRFLSVLCEGEAFHEPRHTITRGEAAEKLQQFYDMRDGKIPINVDGENPQDADKLAERIKEYEKLVKTLPEDGARDMIRTFHTPVSALNPVAEAIEGVAETEGGETLYICVGNGIFDENDVRLTFQRVKQGHYYNMRERGDFLALSELPAKWQGDVGVCALPQEEAVRLGNELLTRLGISGMRLDGIEPAVRISDDDGHGHLPGHTLSGEAAEHGWSLTYARTVSGVPVTQTDIPCDGAETDTNERAPWDYEHLRLTLREDGTLVHLLYASPYDMGATVADDAALLPFAEIAAIYEIISPLTYRYKQESENGLQLTLTEVRLGLMRVTEVNRRDVGTLMPVWDFTAEWKNADGSARSGVVLTLNAMDGSFVDRGLGY